jgi:hypothetical protein
MNPMPLEEALRVLESRLNMQSLVNLDQRVRGLLELARKKKEFALRDKEESLRMVNRQIDMLIAKVEERREAITTTINAISAQEVGNIDAIIESVIAVKERSAQMFTPISNTTAIGYARSVEKVIDFVQDMKEIQLPQKIQQDLPKISVLIPDDLLKQIDLLGTITSAEMNPLASKLGASLAKKLQNDNLTTDDFSKPKNKLGSSRILPEAAQSTKILKVLPHFRDSKIIYRWTSTIVKESALYERSNAGFHKLCDDKGPLLVIVKLANNGAIFGVSDY